jgi:hypothetical protein
MELQRPTVRAPHLEAAAEVAAVTVPPECSVVNAERGARMVGAPVENTRTTPATLLEVVQSVLFGRVRLDHSLQQIQVICDERRP